MVDVRILNVVLIVQNTNDAKVHFILS